MGSEKTETPARWQARPGQECRFSDRASGETVARGTGERHNGAGVYTVTPGAGEAFTLAVKGRTRWALDRLRAAGAQGCTPVTEPAPRWSAYVHDLREMGVEIETMRETHGGDYPGAHGRYVLRATVTPADGGAA